MTVGSRIKQLRQALGLSQQAFAVCLAVRQATVSDWENGKAEPGRGMLRLMADLAEPEGIFGWLVGTSVKPAMVTPRKVDQISSSTSPATSLKSGISLADIHADFVRRVAESSENGVPIPPYYLLEVAAMLLRTHEHYHVTLTALQAMLSTMPIFVLRLNAFGRVVALYPGDGVKVDPVPYIGESLTSVLRQISEAELDGALSRLRNGAVEAVLPFTDRDRHYELKLVAMSEGESMGLVRRAQDNRTDEIGLLLKTG
jgi:DNA-binding XRE family transcriptional regulator